MKLKPQTLKPHENSLAFSYNLEVTVTFWELTQNPKALELQLRAKSKASSSWKSCAMDTYKCGD